MSKQFPALRGVAILLVLLAHAANMSLVIPQLLGRPAPGALQTALLNSLQHLGAYPVPIFLFLSGSFFVYAVNGNGLKTCYKTVVNNVIHVLYPYLLWSLIFYVIIYFGHHEVFSPLGYVKNLVSGYPYDFVPLLIFFYLLAPLLVKTAPRFGWPLLGAIAIYQIALYAFMFPQAVGFTMPSWFHWFAPPVIRTSLSTWAAYFPLGVLYSFSAKKLQPAFNKFRRLIWAANLLALAILLLFTRETFLTVLVTLLAPVLLLTAATTIQRQSIPKAAWLEKIGKASYGLYLANLAVLDAVLVFLGWLVPGALQFPLLLVPALFLITLYFPLLLMSLLKKRPMQPAYRYVFG